VKRSVNLTLPKRFPLRAEVVPFIPKQSETEFQAVPAFEPAQMVLKFLAVRPVPFLPPGILVETRHAAR